ncbi:MAG TPA: hypothetical protein PLL32_03490, partial [Anaeromyxobacteraceae bacterium]|nr:hypothetical protein [Anaeromyxobacteraceae bacterium]
MRSATLLAGLAGLTALAACSGSSTTPTPPPPPAEPEVARPAWSLLVERISRGGHRSFVAMTPERTFVAPVPGVPADALRVVPAPDGRTLAVLRPDDGLVHLWLVDRTGENLRPLVDGLATVGGVSWSPDGRRLAVEVSTLEITADIWVVNADGSGTTNLTPDPDRVVLYDRAPAWSPDGASIAFSSNRSGTTRLWVMGADGSAPRQVLPASLVAAEHVPAWSADGGTLAFVTETLDAVGIGTVRPDGTGHRVFPAPFDAADPAWLPDGRIAFSDLRTGDLEVHLLDPATGATTNLTRNADHDLRASVLRYVAPPTWRGLAAPVRLPGRPAPAGLASADLDGDGVADVASLATAAPEVRLYRGVGGGALAPLGSLEASTTARAIAAGPLAGDGAGDLVVLESDAIALHRGSAGGPGLAERASLLGPPTGMAVADLDRDGLLDVSVIVERPGSGFHLGVYRVDGNDRLIFNVDMATDFTGAGRPCAGDVDGNGSTDVVVPTSSPAAPVVLLPGRGDVTFAAPVVAWTGAPFDADAVPLCADLDGDARADLAILRPGRSRGLTVLPSLGSSFGPGRSIDVSGVDVAAGDLDRDGDLDLVVAAADGARLLFLRNLGDGR